MILSGVGADIDISSIKTKRLPEAIEFSPFLLYSLLFLQDCIRFSVFYVHLNIPED